MTDALLLANAYNKGWETLMNRRTFGQTVAGAALGAALPGLTLEAAPANAAPYGISIMLWTVYTGLPFEERLAKVAQAGYTQVELVGEYEHWAPADFDRANAWRREPAHAAKFDWEGELDQFRAEAEQVLSGPGIEIPGDVFAPG